MAKTYGEKPIIFSFEEGGEEYMIGSEVNLDFKVKWYIVLESVNSSVIYSILLNYW